jgi:hypothetical protein
MIEYSLHEIEALRLKQAYAEAAEAEKKAEIYFNDQEWKKNKHARRKNKTVAGKPGAG